MLRLLILIPVLLIASAYAGTVKAQFDHINTAIDRALIA